MADVAIKPALRMLAMIPAFPVPEASNSWQPKAKAARKMLLVIPTCTAATTKSQGDVIDKDDDVTDVLGVEKKSQPLERVK